MWAKDLTPKKMDICCVALSCPTSSFPQLQLPPPQCALPPVKEQVPQKESPALSCLLSLANPLGAPLMP